MDNAKRYFKLFIGFIAGCFALVGWELVMINNSTWLALGFVVAAINDLIIIDWLYKD